LGQNTTQDSSLIKDWSATARLIYQHAFCLTHGASELEKDAERFYRLAYGQRRKQRNRHLHTMRGRVGASVYLTGVDGLFPDENRRDPDSNHRGGKHGQIPRHFRDHEHDCEQSRGNPSEKDHHANNDPVGEFICPPPLEMRERTWQNVSNVCVLAVAPHCRQTAEGY
jgi:hypothetical protein